MDEISGKFICPICHYNGIVWDNFPESDEIDFKKYLYRKEYINNKLEKKWVIYESNEEKQKIWICCSCCGECGCCGLKEVTCVKFWSFALKCEWCHEGSTKCSTLDCICFPICYLFFYLFYGLFCIWIDIINYFCNCKKGYYFVGIPSTAYYKLDPINYLNYVSKNKIWSFSYSEEEWKNRKPWKCNKCKYESEDFTYFIPKNKDLNKTNENMYLKTEELNLGGLMMSVLFNSVDGKINYSMHCKKTDIFSEVEKKLYDEFPEYKNKNCYFLQSGKIIEKNMTLEKNGIHSGYPIIVNFEE